MPVGGGFLNVTAGARGVGTSLEGYARGEAGYHFASNGSAFAYGEASLIPGAAVNWQTGVGIRLQW